MAVDVLYGLPPDEGDVIRADSHNFAKFLMGLMGSRWAGSRMHGTSSTDSKPQQSQELESDAAS